MHTVTHEVPVVAGAVALLVLLWLGLSSVAPPSPLLGELRHIPLGVDVILDWYLVPPSAPFTGLGSCGGC